jgi:D-alanyl-lipoteichoic acid acyltransferase DltB (MBOAT superfamily)
LPQLREYKSFDYESAVAGLTLLAWGIFKKAVVADRLAMYVDPVYKNPHNFSGASLLATAPLYVFQLYCDFSGYTDMAWGISGFFGYKLIQNFNRPFVAISIADFWKRWHISFSTWLNEYLYNPLSVVLRSWKTMGVITAVMITFFISGVWHGAGWSFAAWGILNGIAMVFEILTLKWKKKIKKTTSPLLYKPVAWTVTMAFILFSFIVGRAITFDNAGYILSNMFSNLSVGIDFKMIGADVYNYIIGIVALLLVFYVEKFKEADGFRLQLLKLPVTVRWSLYIVLVLVVINLGVLGNNKFIYFQF